MSDFPERGGTEVADITATYDPTRLLTVPLFAVRLFAADTDCANAVWSDAELLFCLSRGGNIPELGAALALESAASDGAKMAALLKEGDETKDLRSLAGELRAQAQHLRSIAPILPAVVSHCAVFTMGDTSQGTLGSMDVW